MIQWAIRGVLFSHTHSDWLMEPAPLNMLFAATRFRSEGLVLIAQGNQICVGLCLLTCSSVNPEVFIWDCHQGSVQWNVSFGVYHRLSLCCHLVDVGYIISTSSHHSRCCHLADVGYIICTSSHHSRCCHLADVGILSALALTTADAAIWLVWGISSALALVSLCCQLADVGYTISISSHKASSAIWRI